MERDIREENPSKSERGRQINGRRVVWTDKRTSGQPDGCMAGETGKLPVGQTDG